MPAAIAADSIRAIEQLGIGHVAESRGRPGHVVGSVDQAVETGDTDHFFDFVGGVNALDLHDAEDQVVGEPGVLVLVPAVGRRVSIAEAAAAIRRVAAGSDGFSNCIDSALKR